MAERWAVVIEPCDMEQGYYSWLRDSDGEIVVFGSRQEARKWVAEKASFGFETDDVVYIRISRPGSG
jgi:hypothetical protein